MESNDTPEIPDRGGGGGGEGGASKEPGLPSGHNISDNIEAMAFEFGTTVYECMSHMLMLI